MNKQEEKNIEETARKNLEKSALEPPLYSQEFMATMEEYAFHTLLKHLEEKNIGKEAIDLLENLYMLSSLRITFLQGPQVRYIWNLSAVDVIAGISRGVPALGCHFLTPIGELMEA